MIAIENRREVFWDDFLVDTEKSTATKLLHSPVREEKVMTCGESWEGDGCDYFNILHDTDGTYRMYYLGWSMINPEGTKHTLEGIRVCYAESKDGVTWIKPDLGICEWEGSKHNNIILDATTSNFDNFMVMRDVNQKEGSDELYKGIAVYGDRALWCFISPDGVHFRKGWMMTDKGCFDSLNTVLWDENTRQYIAYIRGFHGDTQENNYTGIRDIRIITSKDFHTWSEPVMMDFQGGADYPLYTNNVTKYYRADHIFVGFPTRYVERPAWNNSFERLCGKESRRFRMKLHPRFGLALTDCVFMCSRDGFRWNRTEEAFIRPGPEQPLNWIYGDGYPAYGLVETPGVFPGTDNEISVYLPANHWSGKATDLWRYTLRLDGFISRHAPYEEKLLVTKPFTFNGQQLHINFSTSAIGYIYVTMKSADGEQILSCEQFGDSTDRIVDFENGSVAQFCGKEVTLEFRMSDADLYSLVFE